MKVFILLMFCISSMLLMYKNTNKQANIRIKLLGLLGMILTLGILLQNSSLH